jgi:hypothetical protein
MGTFIFTIVFVLKRNIIKRKYYLNKNRIYISQTISIMKRGVLS